jgi:pyridoxine 5-phosphate synthase
MPPQLGVNIDHIATLRQARKGSEPDPILAAHEALLGGADIITIHLREDRRHINDKDLARLIVMASSLSSIRINLEMAATDEMLAIASSFRSTTSMPHMCTLVPERRQEVTTEGGLDVASNQPRMKNFVATLRDKGIILSAFIDPDPRQIEASAAVGFHACELHTGPFAAAFAAAGGDPLLANLKSELARIGDAAHRVRALGLRLNAGHALNYINIAPIASLAGIAELHVGHSIVSRAAFLGMRQAVKDMKTAIALACP